jgi:prepilin-type N-terminal cleavage/methylation domain-containing protein
MSKLICYSGKDQGLTLMELVVVLALMSFGLARAVPAARHQLDRMAVVAAREATAGLFHQAREEAVARGKAEVVLTAVPAKAELMAGTDPPIRSNLEEGFGVSLALSGNRQEVRMIFGPLGLGRVTSQTLRFRRGQAEAQLVISSLGRVTRR